MNLFRQLASGPMVLAMGLLVSAGGAFAGEVLPKEVEGAYMGLTYPQSIEVKAGQSMHAAFQDYRVATEDESALRLTVGQRLGDGFHIEYGLQQMKMQATTGDGLRPLNVQAGSVSTLFYLPIAGTVYPFIKFGYAAISAGVEQEFVGTAIGSVGVVVPLMKGWSARFEIEHIDRFGRIGGDRVQAYAGIQIPI